MSATPTAAPIAAAGSYLRTSAQPDAIAGLTVAVMGVPQAMAYAMIAGLPPIYGIYTAIIPCLIAALGGSSSHLVTGPTNAMCMVLFSVIAGITQKFPNASAVEIALGITFLVGVFQFLCGILKLGAIVKYVSNSVVVGFTAGAGILIASNQLQKLLGVKIISQGTDFFSTLWGTLVAIPQSNPYAVGIGLVTIFIVVTFRIWLKKIPGALIALVLVSFVGYFSGWFDDSMGDSRVKIVKDIQEIVPTLDIFSIPAMFTTFNFGLWKEIAAGALAIAILGLVESASIARSIAASSGQRLNFTREFQFQGIANIVGSFCHCFAASGSFTRSAVCFQSGGRTRMAPVLSAVFTAIILFTLGKYANFVPQAALAGILMVIAFTMIERERFAMSWRSGSNSQIVLGGTLAATLFMPLEIAVFVGVLLSIVILLRITGKPDLTQLVQHPEYGFEEVPFNRAAPSATTIINLEGDLYFAAAEDLDYELLQALRPETRVVVLRMKRLRAVGSSALAMIEHFHELLHARGIHLILCGVEESMKKLLGRTGILNVLGEQNIFYADNRIFQSTELALARASSIVDMGKVKNTESVATPSTEKEALASTTVGDIMQKKCLRFGIGHQIREAMWLISQFQKRMKTDFPQTVFLQDLDGKIAAALSIHSIIKTFAAALGEDEQKIRTLDDDALRALLDPLLCHSIEPISRKELTFLTPETPISEAIVKSARRSFATLIVLDNYQRIQGVFNPQSVFCGLAKFLKNDRP